MSQLGLFHSYGRLVHPEPRSLRACNSLDTWFSAQDIQTTRYESPRKGRTAYYAVIIPLAIVNRDVLNDAEMQASRLAVSNRIAVHVGRFEDVVVYSFGETTAAAEQILEGIS